MTDVKFITTNGLQSAKKAARHITNNYLEFVYFTEDVLKKYESNRDYGLGDHGEINFGTKWSLFRGVFRCAKGFLAVHLGDLGESLPVRELRYWKQYNVNPKIIPKDGHFYDYRDTIKRLTHFMKEINEHVEFILNNYFFDLNIKDKRLFNLDKIDTVLKQLKKVINKKTTLDEFQIRIIFLNILVIESVNSALIKTIFSKIDKKLIYSNDTLNLIELRDNYTKKSAPVALKKSLIKKIEPLKSLGLLQKFILFLNVHRDILIFMKIRKLGDLKLKKKTIYTKLSSAFDGYYRFQIYGTKFKNSAYFTIHENLILEHLKFLKILNRSRNSIAAHGFNQSEYEELMKNLGIDSKTDDYSIIFEELLKRVSYDIEHIIFQGLIPLGPPIIEYYKNYLDKSLVELAQSSKYESIFEDIAHYIQECPEFYKYAIFEISKIHKIKKEDREFIIQLGYFIENVSITAKEKTQQLIEYVLEGYTFDPDFTLAHISHIIKNSDNITDKFFDRVYPFAFKRLNDTGLNISCCAQHIIFCLNKKVPDKINRKEVMDEIKGEIYFKLEKL